MERTKMGADRGEDTDIYGRRYMTSRSMVALSGQNAVDANEFNLVKRLQGSLETAKKMVMAKTENEQVIMTYAETLHKGLKVMWVPMVYLGRMPFRLLLKQNKTYIRVNKKSPAYLSCCFTCIITWIVFLWITTGFLILMSSDKASFEDRVLPDYLTQQISYQLLLRFWMDAFIFWTTLLQACVSTTHILYQAEEFAGFIKAWYRVLDLTKIEVSRTLKQFIFKKQFALCLFLLIFIVMFFMPKEFPHVKGTASVIVIAMAQPIVAFGVKDRYTRFPDGKFYFEHFDFVGLIIYLFAVLFSWMYIMQFIVFCRCFRKGLKSINQRIAMILNVNDEPRVGPNALRLTYEYIHKDYLGIGTTGIKIGRIFSWTMCNYYLWAMLVIVTELGEIFNFAKRDYRKNEKKELEDIFMAAGFEKRLPPIQTITNDILHFLLTSICIVYVSHEGSGAFFEGKMGYELARYKGLVDCTTQLERNFIRSIWIIVSEKCRVHVSPGNFFGITYSTVMTVFATAFTYFVFWVQSQGQIGGTGTQDEIATSGLKQASLARFADEDHSPENVDYSYD